MKTRLALVAISTLLLLSRPAHAAADAGTAGRDRVSTAVPEAASRSLELINRERVTAGLPSLALDEEVTEIAARWSRHMAADSRLSHNDDYLSQESMKALDATILGENVAYADTVETIHETLMKSPPHRRNILHRDYQLVGIAAVLTDDGQMYLTQDFLTRQSTTAADSTRDQSASQTGDRRPEPSSARPTAARTRPARQEHRPPARPAHSAAATARRAASAHSAAAVPTSAPTGASRPATEEAPGPAAPSPAADTIPASTPPPAVAAPTMPAPPDADISAPASPVEDHTRDTEPSVKDLSPWSRAALLSPVPLLGLALRPRSTRLSG